MAMVYRSYLAELDEQKAALAARHPGWHVWYVPHSDSSGISHIVWCAHRHPLVNCTGPQELSDAIREAEAAHLAESTAAGQDSGPSPLPARLPEPRS
jgi:hypothetical protein